MNDTLGKFKVFKSSAGSGKTYTLVKEFLRLCLMSEDSYGFSRILAITFTNKATYEMKHRILDALKKLSKGEEKNLSDRLIVETGFTPDEIQQKSGQILKAIVHSYADFSISTIDKFTHRLIRTFAKDLGLPPNFDVELDGKKVLQEVVDLIIDSIGKDRRVTDLLLRFTFARMEEEKSWKIDQELVDFTLDTLQEKSRPYLAELRDLTENDYQLTLKVLKEYVNNFEDDISERGNKALELIYNQDLSLDLLAGRAKISIYFRRMAAKEFDFIYPSKEIEENVKNGNWSATKAKSHEVKAIENIQNELENLYRSICAIRDERFSTYISAQAMMKNIYSLSLVNYIEKQLVDYKKQENIIQISDFNELIADVVENEPMPFIYERLGERYKHIMIDEFQDTSVKQFSNLLPLVEDSLARGNENLIVGDAKQSIYRFRGGEVGQFAEMPHYQPDDIEQNDLYDERMRTLGVHFNEDFLDINWRSLPEIVNFNKHFFDFAINQKNLTTKVHEIYKKHGQITAEGKKGGFVSIEFIEGKNKEAKEIQYLEKIYDRIEEAKTKGFTYSDMAILVRKNKEAKLIAEYLKSQHVEVISSEALLIKNDSQVQFLLNFSAWVFYPEEDIYKKAIIQYLVEAGLLKGDLAHYLQKYFIDKPFYEIFQDVNIEMDINQIRLKSAHEFYEYIIRQFKLNEQYNIYVQFFQDEVMDYFQLNTATIPNFLEWWRENEDKLSISSQEGIDAVNLLTIHKSKGLEFPVVIFPFATQELIFHTGFTKKFIWTKNVENPVTPIPYALVEYTKKLGESDFKLAFDAEFEKTQIDLLNDVYVGFTRAVEWMHIISEKKSEKGKTDRNLNLSDLLEDFITNQKWEEVHTNHFVYGEKLAKQEKNNSLQINGIEIDYLSQAWSEKIAVANSARVQWKTDERVQYGVMLHELLGELKDDTEVDQLIIHKEKHGELSTSEATFFKEKLKNLLSHDQIASYFKPGLEFKSEAELVNKKGNILRPDRVVFFDHKITIIDFKTGENNESHHRQVNEYIFALKEMETIKPVEGYILYTETAKLVKV